VLHADLRAAPADVERGGEALAEVQVRPFVVATSAVQVPPWWPDRQSALPSAQPRVALTKVTSSARKWVRPTPFTAVALGCELGALGGGVDGLTEREMPVRPVPA
jgi:hypothetical protein